MPRPLKTGLDYFPLDTDFFTNKKIKNLRRAHGAIGVLTYLNLLCRVYKNGYYYQFDDLEELSMDIAEEIACAQLRATATGVAETINYLVGRGILAEWLFERGIISGVALQEQYVLSAYKAKRKIDMDVHCLVDVDLVIAKNKVNSEETDVSAEETEVNTEFGTQSKSKVNKSKKESFTTTTDSGVEPTPPTDLEILEFFEKHHFEAPETEAYRFKTYNASRGWDCLPKWQDAALLWRMRMRRDT